MPRLVWNRDSSTVKSWLVFCVDPRRQSRLGWSSAELSPDPDAPAGPWIHMAGLLDKHDPINKIRFMPNSWSRRKYGGACPPANTGVHRYFFVVVGLNAVFDNSPLHHDLKTVLGLLNESGNIVKVGTIMFRAASNS